MHMNVGNLFFQEKSTKPKKSSNMKNVRLVSKYFSKLNFIWKYIKYFYIFNINILKSFKNTNKY
jgi:hypothetical protein